MVLLTRKMFRTIATSRPMTPMNARPPSAASDRWVTLPYTAAAPNIADALRNASTTDASL